MTDLDQLRKKAKQAYKARTYGDAVRLYAEIFDRDQNAAPDVEAADRSGYATALINLNRLDEAVAQLNMALSATPADPRLWHKLAEILARLGRHGDAFEAFAEAGRLAPGVADHEWRMAVELRALGREPEAQAALERCLAIEPDHTEARLMQLEQVMAAAPEEDERIGVDPDDGDGPLFHWSPGPIVTHDLRPPLRSRPWFWALEVVLLLVGAVWVRSQM